MTIHYDLFVIGGGSGGVAAARSSAALGAKVGIAEGDKFGGTCVNRGCMPKKFYMYASTCSEEFESARSYGWSFEKPKFDWQILKERTFKEISRLNGIYDNMLNNSGVKIHNGFAKFIDDKTVLVNGTTITADKFIIAVGGKPFVPNIEGSNLAITSDEAFHLDSLPKSIVIVGGGYIAIEFAGIFNSLGVDTTLMIRKDYILTGFDKDLQNHLRQQIEEKGIKVADKTSPTSITKASDGTLKLGCDNKKEFNIDQIMFATGRTPFLETLDLGNTGVKTDAKGQIEVDEWQQTSVNHIYALGDVTNRNHNLTPVAINEGRSFADTHFGNKKRNVLDFIVPTAIFSQPPVGTVGLGEEEAREKYKNIEIFKTTFGPTKYRLSNIKEKILMKLIVDKDTDKVVGAHMIGPDAGEIIQSLGVALRAGATKHEFDRTVGVHPTIAEEFVTMREAFVEG
jgi:glutathione reductase (NADPH)